LITFRELQSRLISDEKERHLILRASLLWMEFRGRSKESMDPWVETTRPYKMGKKGTLCLVSYNENASQQVQIPFYPMAGLNPIVDKEWNETSESLLRVMRSRRLSFRTQVTYANFLVQLRSYLAAEVTPHQVTWQDIERYLDYITLVRKLSAASIRLTLTSLKFWFRNVLQAPIVNATRTSMPMVPRQPPVVLSAQEVERLLAITDDHYQLLFSLLYGCGLRISEGLSLRVKDIDFANRWVLVTDGKGGRGRHVPLPEKLMGPLQERITYVSKKFQWDLLREIRPWLPGVLAKNSIGKRELQHWQWLFPSKEVVYGDEVYGNYRWHIDESSPMRCFQRRLREAKITKHATPHTLCHSFATHMVQHGVDMKTLQRLLGHSDIQTTLHYAHVLVDGPAVKSPLDYW